MSNPTLTSWAERYGNRQDGHSKLTPIDAYFPVDRPTMTAAERAQDDQNFIFETWQKGELWKFTTQELIDIDAITTRKLKTPDLNFPIVTILQRDRWNSANFLTQEVPKIEGFPGLWSMDNIIVRSAIEPSLRMASGMLSNINMLPWFDALIRGDVFPIDASRRPKKGKGLPLKQYVRRKRPAPNYEDTARERDAMFEYMCKILDYTWGFETPKNDGQSDTLAYTSTEQEPEINFYKAWTSLSTQLVMPLLSGKLTDAERLNGQWHLSNTIVHEVMHAVWRARCMRDNIAWDHDAYFEDEPIAEVGFSFENAVFGGIPEMMGEGGFMEKGKFPILGFFLTKPWLHVANTKLCHRKDPILDDPALDLDQFRYPIKVTAIEDEQQQEFWNAAVQKYGFKIFHNRRTHLGTHITYKSTTWKMHMTTRFSRTKDSSFFDMLAVQPTQQELLAMTPVERKASDYARRLVDNVRFERLFIDKVEDIKGQARDIEKYFLKRTPQEDRTQVWIQFQYYQRAVQNHMEVAVALLAAEKSDETVYTDRRENLLRGNRGIRTFIRTLTGNVKDQSVCYLEFPRLSLSDPTTPSEAAEMVDLKNIVGFIQSRDLRGSFQVCWHIMTSRTETSVLCDSAVRMLASINEEPNWTQQMRLDCLKDGVDTLVHIRGKPGTEWEAPEAWRGVLDQWILLGVPLWSALNGGNLDDAMDAIVAAADSGVPQF